MGRSMTSEDDPGHPGTLGGTEDRAEVLRIGDAIEYDEEGLRIGDQPVEIGLYERRSPSDDALV